MRPSTGRYRRSIADPEPTTDLDAADVLAVNEEFYRAFEARELDAMSNLWIHDERATCTHPGWATLRGWAAVSASWFALFTESPPLQFILTDVSVEVNGDTAWVTLDENLIGDEVGGTVAALNVFVRDDDRWRMVAHHGGPVSRRAPVDP